VRAASYVVIEALAVAGAEVNYKNVHNKSVSSLTLVLICGASPNSIGAELVSAAQNSCKNCSN
jgi:hypothetical protein